MKLFLIFVVFIGFVLIGVFIYLHYNAKKNIYKNLIEFCDYAILEIQFNKANFRKIIEKYLKSTNAEVKNFLNSYLNRVCYSSKMLTYDENVTIQTLFNSIGKKDVDGEIYTLNKYKKLFNMSLDKAKEDEKQKGIVGLKISVITGILFVIILI